MKKSQHHVLYSLIVLAACAVSSLASAVEPSAADKEIAREAYGEAMTREEAKDYKSALDRYQKAHAIMNVPPTGLAVARMQERLGRLVEARDSAIAVGLLPVGPNESDAFKDARKEAVATAERLKSTIPTLRALVQGLPADLRPELLVDGQPVASATIGDYRPINPGAHIVIARAKGYKEARVDVSLAEKERKDVTLILVVDPSAAQKPGPEQGSVTPDLMPPPQAPDQGSSWEGWSLIGVGTAGFGLGLASWLKMRSDRDTVDSHCSSNTKECDKTGWDAAQSGKTWTTVNTVSMIVGAVGVGTGVYFLLSSPGSNTKSSTAVGASPAPSGGALFLHHTF